MENETKFVVVIRNRKTGKDEEIIGNEKGLMNRESLRVLSGVRINLDHKNYIATTELYPYK